MAKLTVSSHFVTAALGGALRRGYDITAMLTQAGIDPLLLKQTGSRVTGAQYTRLMQILWTTMQDEYMGFGASRSKPGTFATFCYLTINCHTLESVYKRGYVFYNLFENPMSMRLEKQGKQASLIIGHGDDLYDPDHFLQESILVIWHRLSCWLTGQQIILDEVCLDYPEPPHVEEYKRLFYGSVKFNQPRTSLTFNQRFLGLPIIRDEPALKEFLKSSPADLLARPDDRTSHTAQIRAFIGKDLRQELPSFESVAQHLYMSPQTLRRRLREENTSYQEIKDNLRRDQAIYHLSRCEHSINDIAFMVGFTEPSTFHRAFKKWTGLTPGAYRENEQA
ncbi:MAG: AraC family transcriptional regulator [Hahellaceae bacterium]|nr:AraC family transcriptional regulator [Hahellaceae bacterium]